MKFSEIGIGAIVLFNGHYAVKRSKTEIYIPRLGVDGIFVIGENEELELEEENKDEHI